MTTTKATSATTAQRIRGRYSTLLAASLVALAATACANTSEGPTDGDGDGPASAPQHTDPVGQSCRYDNIFTNGPECKLYVGAAWHDSDARLRDCGSGVVEDAETAVVVADVCPERIGAFVCFGSCAVAADTSTEVHVHSYSGAPSTARTACEQFAGGTWTGADSEDPFASVRPPLAEAFDALDGTEEVRVSPACKERDCLLEMVANQQVFELEPLHRRPHAGLIFYPGGLIDPRAYAPAALALAQAGFYVALVPMDGFLAFTGVTRADDVRRARPDIDTWLIGGHSLGGSMAMAYALTDGGQSASGFFLWAAAITAEQDYTNGSKPVIQLFGSLDNNLLGDRHAYLPEHTQFVTLQGANHSQFGSYRDDTDVPAEISRAEQQQRAVALTARFVSEALDAAELTPMR